MADTVFVSAIFVLPVFFKKSWTFVCAHGPLFISKTTNHLEKNIL